jgi:phospholipid/cholesterol/gamma-HCH transport system permease protein
MSAQQECTLSIDADSGDNVLRFAGSMTANTLGPLWARAMHAVRGEGVHRVDLTEVKYLDGSGVGLVLDLRRRTAGTIEIDGLAKEFEALFTPFEKENAPASLKPERSDPGNITSLGKLTVSFLQDIKSQISFAGELLVLLVRLLAKPGMLRWREVFIIFRKVGVDALFIVGLIGFLMGLILAFQSAAPLQTFGVDIFVVNLVALAMLRELGVIMTAIVLAGRSGSAFAAEIGTMKVNEEINALQTMGLDPARFLVLPRVLAGTLAMPVLTIYGNVVGIFGGLLVVTSFGHSWSAVWAQLLASASVSDVATGMIKSVVFGFMVAAIGCLRGLQTKSGALAVGESTTRAVVASIVLIIFTDMIFALVFYAIGF